MNTTAPATPVTLAALLATWPTGEVLNTKEIAAKLGVTTRKAYDLMLKQEEFGSVSAYGYRVKAGHWEDREHSGRTSAGLYWQRN